MICYAQNPGPQNNDHHDWYFSRGSFINLHGIHCDKVLGPKVICDSCMIMIYSCIFYIDASKLFLNLYQAPWCIDSFQFGGGVATR